MKEYPPIDLYDEKLRKELLFQIETIQESITTLDNRYINMANNF